MDPAPAGVMSDSEKKEKAALKAATAKIEADLAADQAKEDAKAEAKAKHLAEVADLNAGKKAAEAAMAEFDN